MTSPTFPASFTETDGSLSVGMDSSRFHRLMDAASSSIRPSRLTWASCLAPVVGATAVPHSSMMVMSVAPPKPASLIKKAAADSVAMPAPTRRQR